MSKIFVDVCNHQINPINPVELLKLTQSPCHGASDIFLGTVRDMNLGRKVKAVSYDVHDKLACQVFKTICHEAIEFTEGDINLSVVHAQGRLNVGESSIIIVVCTPHRAEAFKACRYVIEEIKHRAPVWKKEHYIDGDSKWVQGHALCQHA